MRRSPCAQAISLHKEALRERGQQLPDDRMELVELASKPCGELFFHFIVRNAVASIELLDP